MYEIFCKYSYDYYFPHTSYYYFPHTIKEVFKEVIKEYTTRARDLLFILEGIKKEVFFYLYTSLLCPISNISIVKISSWISANIL